MSERKPPIILSLLLGVIGLVILIAFGLPFVGPELTRPRQEGRRSRASHPSGSSTSTSNPESPRAQAGNKRDDLAIEDDDSEADSPESAAPVDDLHGVLAAMLEHLRKSHHDRYTAEGQAAWHRLAGRLATIALRSPQQFLRVVEAVLATGSEDLMRENLLPSCWAPDDSFGAWSTTEFAGLIDQLRGHDSGSPAAVFLSRVLAAMSGIQFRGDREPPSSAWHPLGRELLGLLQRTPVEASHWGTHTLCQQCLLQTAMELRRGDPTLRDDLVTLSESQTAGPWERAAALGEIVRRFIRLHDPADFAYLERGLSGEWDKRSIPAVLAALPAAEERTPVEMRLPAARALRSLLDRFNNATSAPDGKPAANGLQEAYALVLRWNGATPLEFLNDTRPDAQGAAASWAEGARLGGSELVQVAHSILPLVASTPSKSVRMSLVRFLGHHSRELAEARPVLERAAQQDPDAEIRLVASVYVEELRFIDAHPELYPKESK